MIYRITFLSDESDNFRRTFEADADASFLDLHNAILESAGYPNDQMTSFFICNERWEKGQEITLIEMDGSYEYDNMTMENTRLSDLLFEQKQRLVYVFDPLFDRQFFGSLVEIQKGNIAGVKCVESIGKAPKQLHADDSLTAGLKSSDIDDLDNDFYGDSEYDIEDLDSEGFQDLSFDDGSMF